MSDVTSPRIAIIGAGVIGLSIAWRLAQRGAHVTVFERNAAGQGASHAAAGMLAACAEVEPGEEHLFALNRASQALWPEFAAELEYASGMAVDLRREGTLVVALTPRSRTPGIIWFSISPGSARLAHAAETGGASRIAEHHQRLPARRIIRSTTASRGARIAANAPARSF